MTLRSVDNCIKRKRQMKKFLAERLNFAGKKPLLGIILDRELSVKEETVLQEILEGTGYVNVQVVILADTNLMAFSVAHTIVVPYNRIGRREILEAADIALSFSFSDVEEMLLHGTIPVSPVRPEVMDYNPNHETGNGFIYRKDGCWSIFAALVRALETYKFPYDWRNIVRQGLEKARE
ncbi:hypothetical protein HYW82_04500 [Candidatus Peregrinibacteria bacterium]|nr:hypothetical protein [Candidatus Peregrinibacteria bacterium]